jgi:hypothetical protein
VTLADKLHNLTTIALDLEEGRPVWPLFNAPKDDVLAYYRATIACCGNGDDRLEHLAKQALTMIDAVASSSRSDGENPTATPLPG